MKTRLTVYGKYVMDIFFVITAGPVATAQIKATPPPEPVLKPGLWMLESSDTLRTDDIPSLRICVGAGEKEKAVIKAEWLERSKYCKFLDYAMKAKQMSYRSICERHAGAKIEMTVQSSGDFSSAFIQTKTASSTLPAPYGGAVQVVKYRYVSSCPKGMAEGTIESVDKNGRVLGTRNRYTDLSKQPKMDGK